MTDRVYVHRSPVRFTHTDPAGYVFFPRFFEMFQAAVEEWFNRCLQMNYAELILEQGIGFPTAHTECDFLRPCRLGEVLELDLVLERIGRTSFTLRFDGHIGDKPRLRARSVLVAIELGLGRPQPLTPLLQRRLDSYLATCRRHDAQNP
ncbi:MAG: acyl-CoA thioesterase [Pseudomonadota bacterium]|nr:MAG: acyl-CoA thioesterase [Pseudomonadota bacterium]